MKEFRIYNTLKAESCSSENMSWSEDPENFEWELNEAIELDAVDLAEYADETIFAEKIKSIHIETEKFGGRLYGVAVCKAADNWNDTDTEALKTYLSGQYADGWGEGFEQRPISEYTETETETYYDEDEDEEYIGEYSVSVEVCVSFWQSDDGYRIMTEEELKG